MRGFWRLLVAGGTLACLVAVAAAGAVASASAAPSNPRHGSSTIRVKAPGLTIAGSFATVRGSVGGKPHLGQVTLERQRPPHKPWRVIARARAKNGRFRFH